MNTARRHIFIACLITGLYSITFAQSIILEQTHDSGIYQTGEPIRVTLLAGEKATEPPTARIWEGDAAKYSQETLAYPDASGVFFNRSLTGPSHITFELKTESQTASIGAVIDPEKYTPGTQRPADFDQYWQQEKRKLRALPLEVKATPVDGIETGYLCQDMELNCTGPKPARGYFAKPKTAQPKSLPIVLNVHAAGVSGSWCRSEPRNAMHYARMGKGALCFDLNAHGMLNGQPDSYYTDLENGELKYYQTSGLENRDTVYFRGMYLRLIRTLDFLTSQPEWDGKRLLVIGESQGGGQALAAAGLDHRVDVAIATVPAMCDWGGTLVGRKGGWPQPFATQNDRNKMLAALPYFDTAHLLKGSQATLIVEIGLIDTTCSPESVYAAINQSSGKKIIYPVPYRGHHVSQKAYQKTWENTVYQPKMAFISDYLK